MDGCRQIPLIF
jgi:hypothetical protein